MYRCTKCNSPEVETLSWRDLNTGEEQDGEIGEYYCRSCGAHTDVYLDDKSEIEDDEDEQLD